jgi:hydrogenase expression/formation protein HypC
VCLALPARIESVHARDGVVMAQVDVRGVRQEICLEYVPEAGPGEWVLVHLGMAIQHLDEPAAREHLELLEAIGALNGDGSDPGETRAETG